MREELHIAGVVVHAAPKRRARVEHAIAALPGAEIHGSSDAGKIVVTLEAATDREMGDQLYGIQRIDGVLSAALVYQCADSLDAMNEEMPDVDAPA
jgi:nitrate reductase NapD